MRKQDLLLCTKFLHHLSSPSRACSCAGVPTEHQRACGAAGVCVDSAARYGHPAGATPGAWNGPGCKALLLLHGVVAVGLAAQSRPYRALLTAADAPFRHRSPGAFLLHVSHPSGASLAMGFSCTAGGHALLPVCRPGRRQAERDVHVSAARAVHATAVHCPSVVFGIGVVAALRPSCLGRLAGQPGERKAWPGTHPRMLHHLLPRLATGGCQRCPPCPAPHSPVPAPPTWLAPLQV